MKYLKMLGLAAIAAAALMALIGTASASATVICSTTASPCPAGQSWPAGTVLDFSLEPETTLIWRSGAGETIETCQGVTLRAHIANAGGATSTVRANNTTLDWSGCTWANKTIALGGLEIHNISGTSNGTLTASEEISWTFNSVFFGSCVYAWKAGKQFGTITEGKPATLDLNSLIEKVSGSSFACPENGTLIGSFTLTEPSNTTLSVEPS